MNATAERLTGWSIAEARGVLLRDVFRIVHAGTREPVEDPVNRVLSTGTVVELANHTALLSRSGAEFQVADSAAPIRGLGGTIIWTIAEGFRPSQPTGQQHPLLDAMRAAFR